MKIRELAAVLRELEKHPRLTSCTIGDLRVTFADGSMQEAAQPQPDDGPQSLPDGVIDPRRKIDEIYRRARAAAAPARDEAS